MTRILICDDHPVIRDAIAICIRTVAPGSEVGLAGSVRQALERLSDPDHWDLVVLDLALPDARGIDALIRVRQRAPDAPVMVLSASEDHGTMTRALKAGAAAFLPKSGDRTDLLGSLQRLLGVPTPQSDASSGAAASGLDDDSVHEALAAMSPRQVQVLRLLVRGLPNKEICRELGLSENTVKIHIGAVLRGLNARNRTEAVALAGRVGFGAN